MAVNECHTADGHVLVAHNEDWIPEDEPDVFIIHAEPDDEPPFLSHDIRSIVTKYWFKRIWYCPML